MPTPIRTPYEGYIYRELVTNLDGTIISILDRLSSNRSYERTLNAAAVARGRVPSDSFVANALYVGDGHPNLDHSDRMLFLLRREGSTDLENYTPWKARFAGVLMTLEDQDDTGSDVCYTSYTAYDPWQLLTMRPVIDPTAGYTILTKGMWAKYPQTADQVVLELLRGQHGSSAVFGGDFHWTGGLVLDQDSGTVISVGRDCEAHIDWGQTPYYGGTIETSGQISKRAPLHFAAGTSVADAFAQLTSNGYCDIVLNPIYDVRRPGYICELTVRPRAGAFRDNAVMAWDRAGRSLTGMDDLHDGSKLLTRAKYYGGAAGHGAKVQSSAASVARYGDYWLIQYRSEVQTPAALTPLAQANLALLNKGAQTLVVRPTPERNPIPYIDYTLGDTIPVYASSAKRQAIAPVLGVDPDTLLPTGQWSTTTPRVYGISIALDDNALETVDRLLFVNPEL